jgi:cytochrome c peroxidase
MSSHRNHRKSKAKELLEFAPGFISVSAFCLITMVSGAGIARADGGAAGSLKKVPVPAPANLSSYVQNKSALVALGKSLFWDMQTGNDGKQACATCHFHAGADHRQTNQDNPHGGNYPVNTTMIGTDFPTHTQVVTGSAGVPARLFNDVKPGHAADDSTAFVDPTYSINGVGVRRVTGRNTPSVINAVFNVRNFWDGRANNTFSVFTPFGNSDPSSNVVVESNGSLRAVKEHIENSSLASQSVGPPNNGVEMSSAGRTWPKLGKKMLSLTPLAGQRVHPQDSVLAAYASNSGTGLGVSYASLIQLAFVPKYWSSNRQVDGTGADIGTGDSGNTSRYSQMEYNFALFWGLAVQAYEATLVSDGTPYDQFVEGNKNALTAIQAKGMDIFNGKGQCKTCHSGAEFTAASYTALNQTGPVQGISHGLLTDTGFFRTGVRPVAEDGGIAGNDGFGKPLSLAVQQNPSKAGVTGAVKTPGLRNAEFTGPYFHNGGKSTLEQVVAFYSQGGDFPNDGVNLGPGIQNLGLNASDQQAVVEFVKSLSDDRVKFEKAPFDHPQLCVADGEKFASPGVLQLSSGHFQNEAADNMVELSETGASGGLQLQTFAELIGATPASGPRAHDLKTACTMNLHGSDNDQ